MVAMKVLSAEEMQTCDRVTAERYGVSSIELMRAASAAVDAVCAGGVSACATGDGVVRERQQRRRRHDGGAASGKVRT